METKSVLSSEQRKFLLTLTGASIALWNMCFELGAWGQIFYDHFFYVWILSLSLGIAVFLFPEFMSGMSFYEKFAIAFPSFWLAASVLAAAQFIDHVWMESIIALGVFVVLCCLPVLFKTLVSLFEPDAEKMTSKDLLKLSTVLVVVAVSGYLSGKFNYVFMDCEDFLIAGSSAPPECRMNGT